MGRTTVLLLLALLLSACGIRIEVGGGQPSPQAGPAGAPTSDAGAARPVDTTVDATPGPADTETREDDEESAARITRIFWQSWFEEQGRRYAAPRVAGGYTGTNGPACGNQRSVPGNAYYCPRGNFIAWDEGLMEAGYTQIGDAWVYLVIAHEWAHAVQAQLPERLVSQQIELQADCLAGAALQGAADRNLVVIEPGDDEEIRQTLVAVADDFPWTDERSHGNAEERVGAFGTGVSGGVDACLA